MAVGGYPPCADYGLELDVARGHYRTRGSLIRNNAPPPFRFSADICPSCASTMVRAMDSPMPMPSALVVKNGSKTCF